MPTPTNDGGPAFPGKAWVLNPLTGNSYEVNEPGMSLRDWLAGQVLAAAISAGASAGTKEAVPELLRDLAAVAYQAADAMLTARAKP